LRLNDILLQGTPFVHPSPTVDISVTSSTWWCGHGCAKPLQNPAFRPFAYVLRLGLVAHLVSFLSFEDIALFSIVAVSYHNPTTHAHRLEFLHTLVNSCYCLAFGRSHGHRCEMTSPWPLMLSVSSSALATSVWSWRNVSSGPLPIVSLVFCYCWLVGALYLF
jgi:hypothetical protein